MASKVTLPPNCMDQPPKRTAEYLGSIKINNGQHHTELRRESDPSGSTVVHAVRKSPYVHERWHSAGKLDPDLFAAAEKLRMDFERAGLIGSYARLDLLKTRAGQQEMSDRVALAKARIRDALNALGRGKEGQSQSQSNVWNVVGLGLNLDQWTEMVRKNGGSMNADNAAGVSGVAKTLLGLRVDRWNVIPNILQRHPSISSRYRFYCGTEPGFV